LPIFHSKLVCEWHTIFANLQHGTLTVLSGFNIVEVIDNIAKGTDQCNKEIKYDGQLTLYSEVDDQQHPTMKRAEVFFSFDCHSGMRHPGQDE